MSKITLRFRNWASSQGNEQEFFRLLLEEVLNKPVVITQSTNSTVDIQIESVYKDSLTPSPEIRLHRFIKSLQPGGIDFNGGKYSTNQQPTKKARYNIFYTGENERPPEGRWDAYLSFDLHSFGERNAYLPLWWVTSTDLLFPKISPYLGKEIALKELLKQRSTRFESRKKFCVAFIGKAYPFRMHALTALSKIGKVDVFGAIARNTKFTSATTKYEIAQNYRFVFAFENDLYPGYVTEKAVEAWATGAVPLYWGSDPAGYINPKSLINLSKFNSMELFIKKVEQVNSSKTHWEKYASEPFLQKKPNLKSVIEVLRKNLAPLI
jgi:hypothetical protein